MKIHFEKGDTVLDYELKPLKETHFRTLSALTACALYVGLTWVIATTCGIVGLIPLAFVTVILVGLDKI